MKLSRCPLVGWSLLLVLTFFLADPPKCRAAADQTFSIAIGDTVSTDTPTAGAGRIEAAGDRDLYSFTAAGGESVYFDEVSGNGCNTRLRWRLTDPDGGQVFDEVFAGFDACGSGGDVGIRTMSKAGTYRITVYGVENAVDTYSFRIAPAVPQTFVTSIGQTVSNGVPSAGAGNIESAGNTDTYTFQASGGEVVYFDEMTGNGCNVRLRWRLTDPDGAQMFDESFAAQEACGSGGDAGIRTLSKTGTYKIVVYGIGDAVETYSFRLAKIVPQNFVTAIGQTVTDGIPAVGAGNIESPGATDTYTFQANGGEVVYFDEITGNGCNSRLRWRLTDPDGGQVFDEPFAAQDACGSGGDAGIKTLSKAGSYKIQVYGVTDAVDTYSFQVVRIVPQTFTTAIGQTVTNGIPGVGAGNIESPGATDTYTFQANGGEVVYFDEITGNGCNSRLRWRLTDPDGGQLFDEPFAAQDACGSGGDAGIKTLSKAGSYKLLVYGVTDGVDTYSFQVVRIVPQTFTTAIGQTVTNGIPAVGAGNIESPGATDTYTFQASGGEVVYFDELTGNGCSSRLRWRLTDPDGGQVFDEPFAALEACGSGGDAGIKTLGKAGSYKIQVYGVTDGVDTYSFQLVRIVPQNFVTAIGQTVTNGIPAVGAGNIESPGATDTYTFQASGGEVVYFDEMTGNGCFSRLRWRLTDPDGGQVFDEPFAGLEACGSGGDAGIKTLSKAGSYRVQVYGVTDGVDTYSFRLVPVSEPSFTIAIGQTVTNGIPAVGAGNIESPGTTDTYTFTAKAGEQVYFDELTGNGCFSRLRWRLTDPDGGQLFDEPFAAVEACGSGGDAGMRTLEQAGTYKILVYGVGDGVDTYSFKLVPVAATVFQIVIGQVVTNGVPGAGAGVIENPGATDTFNFNANANDLVYFDELSGNGCSSILRWRLTDPKGAVVFDEAFARQDGCGSGGSAGRQTLTNAGPYRITVYGNRDAVGDYSFAIYPLRPPFISPIGDRRIHQGGSISLQVVAAASSPVGNPLRYEIVSGPVGMKVGVDSGILSWTAPADAAGSFPARVRVLDALGAEAQADLKIEVTPAADLAVTRLEVASSGETGATFGVTLREGNIGSLAAPGPRALRLWLSTDATAGGDDLLLAEYNAAGTLAPGQFVERTAQFNFPNLSGQYFLIAQADAANAVAEADEENNFKVSGPITVAPAYTVTVQTELELAPSGTAAVLSGLATRRDGGPAALLPVDVLVRTRGTTRIIAAQTDENGRFVTTFRPLLGEAGNYTIAAAQAGENNAPPQDSFKLVGMTFPAKSAELRLAAKTGRTLTAVLRNNSEVPLTGLTATLVNPPTTANIKIVPTLGAAIAPDSETPLTIQVTSLADESYSGTVGVLVTSAEGARAQFNLNLAADALEPRFVVSPASLVAGMVRTNQTMVNFTIQNQGGQASGPVNILLPPLSWMSVANSLPFPALAPGQSNEVTLLLQPPADLLLGAHAGSIVVSDGTNRTAVPFVFTALSDALGSLTVEVVDEYTYYADGSPRVAGALVVARDHNNSAEVGRKTAGADGKASFAGLREGYYDLEVTAEKHSPFRGTIFVRAGQDNAIQPFLTRETIRYEFSVTPATIEDRARIRIETTFETVVPLPVITIEPNVIDLEDIQADRTEIELKITNHGLVAAQDFHLSFGSNDRWRLTPFQEEFGALEARSSIVVPLIIERLGGVAMLAARARGPALQAGGGGSCGLGGNGCYTLICGTNKNSYCVPVVAPESCEGSGGGSFIPWGYFGDGPGSYTPPVVSSTPTLCDPCGGKVAGALGKFTLGQLLPLIPVVGPLAGCMNDGGSCLNALNNCSTNAAGCDSQATGLDCASAAVSCGAIIAVGAGASAVGTPLAVIGLALALGTLGHDIGEACKPEGGGKMSLRMAGTDPTFFPGQAKVREEGERLLKIAAAWQEIFGEEIWLNPKLGTNYTTFIGKFLEAAAPTSGEGRRITAPERAGLLAGTLPEMITREQVGRFFDRWNRTLDYNARRIFRLTQVPAGESVEFIALDVMAAKWVAASKAVEELAAEGYGDDIFGGMRAALQQLNQNLSEGGGGICARVRVRLDQDAVVTRSAFNAKLELDNASGDPLTGIRVELQITDQNGVPANALFGVLPPDLSGLTAVDGTGVVSANSSGTASWIMVPGHEAAPSPDPQLYFVGGFFSYTQQGTTVRVPLTPAPITVHPTPRLSLAYFHERDVLADDPFTDAVEASVPYSLAVMVSNTGFGQADNVRIISSQPKIVENEKGLLIDFSLIGSEVAGQAATPSLTADFGNIAPGSNKIARWLFTSTLQGQFIDYSATFENTGPLKNFPELSTIEQVSIHELTHIVRAAGAGRTDDGLPDFLVNDVQDDAFLPETLYLSDGSTNAVSVVLTGTFDGAPSLQDLEVQLTATAPVGWVYFRLPDPKSPAVQLARVLRADGSEVPVGPNAWTTDRTFIAGGRRPRYENKIHLFDRFAAAGPVSYKLIYSSVSTADATPPTSGMIRLPASSGAQIPLQWFGGDNSGGSGLAFYDVYVSIDGGPASLWQAKTTSTGALYPGENGRRYAFYTVATDFAGNAEAVPGVPDTETVVNRSNTAPRFVGSYEPVRIKEGDTAQLKVSAIDFDQPPDVLTYGLGTNAPTGASIDAKTGLITWPTGEGNGPSTTQFTVTVTDNGIPNLSSSTNVTIIVAEVNQAPVVEPLPSRTIREGQHLRVPITATDADLPAQALFYRLAVGAPAGVTVDGATGLLDWTPNSRQGPSTNDIVVHVSDGLVLTDVTLRVVVLDSQSDFALSLGRTEVHPGETAGVSMQLNSGVDLAELSFLVEAPALRFKNLTLSPTAPEVASSSIVPVGDGLYQVVIGAAPGRVLQFNKEIAQLNFEAQLNQASGLAALAVTKLTGVRLTGEALNDAVARDGAVAVLGPELLLDVDPVDRSLILHGHVGDRVILETRPHVAGEEAWGKFLELTLQTETAKISLDQLPPRTADVFIRARRQ